MPKLSAMARQEDLGTPAATPARRTQARVGRHRRIPELRARPAPRDGQCRRPWTMKEKPGESEGGLEPEEWVGRGEGWWRAESEPGAGGHGNGAPVGRPPRRRPGTGRGPEEPLGAKVLRVFRSAPGDVEKRCQGASLRACGQCTDVCYCLRRRAGAGQGVRPRPRGGLRLPQPPTSPRIQGRSPRIGATRLGALRHVPRAPSK